MPFDLFPSRPRAQGMECADDAIDLNGGYFLQLADCKRHFAATITEAAMYRASVIAGVLLATICWFAVAQSPLTAQNLDRQGMTAAWEYRELEIHGGRFDRYRDEVNRLGREGWELATTLTPAHRDAANILVFKRRR